MIQEMFTEHHFNPLPRKEGDFADCICSSQFIFDFNPLPRKEGDQAECSGIVAESDFNPLPRKEGDYYDLINKKIWFGFQSTPS